VGAESIQPRWVAGSIGDTGRFLQLSAGALAGSGHGPRAGTAPSGAPPVGGWGPEWTRLWTRTCSWRPGEAGMALDPRTAAPRLGGIHRWSQTMGHADIRPDPMAAGCWCRSPVGWHRAPRPTPIGCRSRLRGWRISGVGCLGAPLSGPRLWNPGRPLILMDAKSK